MKPKDLERGDPRIPQVGFLESLGLKFRVTLGGRLENIIVFKSGFSKVCFLNSAYLLIRKFIWGDSKRENPGF